MVTTHERTRRTKKEDNLNEVSEEAGVKDLMELCENIEDRYFAAVSGTCEYLQVYTSDSTN